ncbi:NUDIX hydrolase [Cellulosilyticum sp. I15G10I2]|uniref:NUDIX hydrolase n=1 Tax=Cellulosilyticum sp. I15G10I2 TaxID=1892843 RepID=UPI00085BB23B|nr:NUDIX hydrolase [Cellulosilyticum sp. I15G10I2]
MNQNIIQKLTCLAETRFLSLYDATYQNKNGKTKHWMIASRKNYETLIAQYFEQKEDQTDAVVIAALHKPTQCLVLIRQFRVPLNDYVYELPAGLIDHGEDINKALTRELKEETGLSVLKITETMGSYKAYLSAGMTEESAALIYCTCEGTATSQYLEEDEVIEAFLVSQDEAKKLIKNNVKMDIKALMAVQSFIKLGAKLFEELSL